MGSDRTECGTSPYTPGPGHTRTPLWLWTGARPGTEHPSVSAPASLCILFLLSVSLAPTLFLSICLIALLPSFQVSLPAFLITSLSVCISLFTYFPLSLCLQSSVSNTMPVTPGQLLGMWPPSLLT